MVRKLFESVYTCIHMYFKIINHAPIYAYQKSDISTYIFIYMLIIL